MTSKEVHAMTPQELADAGIPVEAALRARIMWCERQAEEADRLRAVGRFFSYRGETYGLRSALAIIEAQR